MSKQNKTRYVITCDSCVPDDCLYIYHHIIHLQVRCVRACVLTCVCVCMLWPHACVCVCACTYARSCVYVCVCMYVWRSVHVHTLFGRVDLGRRHGLSKVCPDNSLGRHNLYVQKHRGMTPVLSTITVISQYYTILAFVTYINVYHRNAYIIFTEYSTFVKDK
jgi:hypothetical protein